MKKLAFCMCLLAIGCIGAMGTNACSSSSNAGSGSSSGGTEAGDETGGSSGSSSGGGQDSSTSSSGGSSSSSGSSSGVEAGNCDVPLDGAFSCGAGDASAAIQPPNTQSPGCDQCIEGCCAFTWCACAGNSGMDDAGQPTGCLGFVECVESCLYPESDSGSDAGTLNTCSQQCDANYLMGQVDEGTALLSCLVGSCASTTQCGL
jgi:hypothetical protein